jgi:methylated-DNA-[protein]-cysteine S-methyltransferase
MGLSASSKGITAIVLPCPTKRAVLTRLGAEGTGGDITASPLLRRARTQIVEFLKGRRRRLTIPVDLSGGTPFQQRVWRESRRIPYGRSISYRGLAQRVGGRQYARAVGLALGGNPVPLVVPCHRVLASDGSLGGFSGGLKNKRRLLAMEGMPAMQRAAV